MINLKINVSSKTLSIVLISSILSLVFVAIYGVNFNPDSYSYLNNEYVRPPAYPLIIDLLEIFFGKYNLKILAFVQIFFWLIISIYFSQTLCELFSIHRNYQFLFLLILILPLNPQQQYGNSILTESFSYVCCILVFLNTYNSYALNRTKYLFYLFLTLFFALTLRHQMVFLNFALFAVGLIILIVKEYKKAFLLFMISVLSFIFASLINKSYSMKNFDNFEENKRIGLQLIVLPLFNLEESTLLKINANERKAIIEMKNLLKTIDPYSNKENLTKIKPSKIINHYADSYNSIISYSILPVVEKYYPNITNKQRDDRLIELSLLILTASIKNEPLKTIKIYFSNIIQLGFFGPLWFLICLFISFFSLINFYQKKSSINFLILFLCLGQFINILLVSIFEPVLFRYSFYTNLSLCCLIMAISIKGLKIK